MQDQKSKSRGGVITGSRTARGTLRAPDPDLWLNATLERPIARSVLDGLKLRRSAPPARPPIREQVFSPELRSVTDSVVAHARENDKESRAVESEHPNRRSAGALRSEPELPAIHYDDPALPALELSEEVRAELRPRRIIRARKDSAAKNSNQSASVSPADSGAPDAHAQKSETPEPKRTTEFEPDLVLPAFQDAFEYVPAGSRAALESHRATIQPTAQPAARIKETESHSLKQLDDASAEVIPSAKVSTNTDNARPIVTATPLSLTPDLDDELAPELPIDLESPLSGSALKSDDQTRAQDTTVATLDDVWLLDDRELIEHVLLDGDADDSTHVSSPPEKTDAEQTDKRHAESRATESNSVAESKPEPHATSETPARTISGQVEGPENKSATQAGDHSQLHLGDSSSADIFIDLPTMDKDMPPARPTRTTQLPSELPVRRLEPEAKTKTEAVPDTEPEVTAKVEAESESAHEQSTAFKAKGTRATDSPGYIQPQLDSTSPGYVVESQPQPWQAQSLQEVSAYIFRESHPPLPVDIIERLKAVYMEESTQSDVFEPIMRQIAEICSADAYAFVLLNRELMVYQCLLHHNLDELTTRNLFFGLRDSYVDHEVSHQTIEFTTELRDAFAFSKRFSSECLHYYHSMVLFSLRPFDTHGHLLLFFRAKPEIDVGATTDRLAPVFRDLIPAILRHRDVTWDRERFLHPDTMIMDEIYRLFREISRGGSESIHVLHIMFNFDSDARFDSHSDSGYWQQTLGYLADGLVSLLHRDERLVMAAPDRLLVILRNTAPDEIQRRATELADGQAVQLEYKCMRFPDEGSNLYNYIAPARRK
ncbi:MAG: hypothetical protein KDK27_01785 [Leptospiraceae bacterium]|nr:hypothetical protein [Leptospiraceae bacterium]